MKKLLSRKFLTGVFTILFIILTQLLEIPVDETAYNTLVGVAIAYILGESYVDGKK